MNEWMTDTHSRIACRCVALRIFVSFSLFCATTDEMIASRRRQEQSSSTTAARRSSSTKPPKSVSNADRAVATARAKREATMAARRGLASTPKASRDDIERAVAKQAAKTAIQKQRQQQQSAAAAAPPAHETGAARAERRRQKRAASAATAAFGTAATGRRSNQVAATTTVATGGGQSSAVASVVSLARPPPRNAIRAAVNAMEETGFRIPEGACGGARFRLLRGVLNGSRKLLRLLLIPHATATHSSTCFLELALHFLSARAGMQMVISFAPAPATTMSRPNQRKGAADPPAASNRRGGVGGRGRKGGR